MEYTVHGSSTEPPAFPRALRFARTDFNVRFGSDDSGTPIWLPVAQLGPDFLLLDMVADHPPCDAVIKLRVDKAGSSPSSKGNVQAHDFSKMVLTAQDQR